jgi:hypothetical protein
MNGWTRLSKFLRIAQKAYKTHDGDTRLIFGGDLKTLQVERTPGVKTSPLFNDGKKEFYGIYIYALIVKIHENTTKCIIL